MIEMKLAHSFLCSVLCAQVLETYMYLVPVSVTILLFSPSIPLFSTKFYFISFLLKLR